MPLLVGSVQSGSMSKMSLVQLAIWSGHIPYRTMIITVGDKTMAAPSRDVPWLRWASFRGRVKSGDDGHGDGLQAISPIPRSVSTVVAAIGDSILLTAAPLRSVVGPGNN